MTLDQLRIFVAVDEREHVTRAAEVLHVTQSAASAAIAALEGRHNVPLFHRVGRRIELTDAGRMFLAEARAVLAKAASAELALGEFGGLKRGNLRLVASQTITAYWLPERLAAFHQRYPQIELSFAIANTEGAAKSVHDGEAELGFMEGAIDDPALARWPVATDRVLLVGKAPVDNVDNDWIMARPWIMRERGSGTRSTFEEAIRARSLEPEQLNIVDPALQRGGPGGRARGRRLCCAVSSRRCACHRSAGAVRPAARPPSEAVLRVAPEGALSQQSRRRPARCPEGIRTAKANGPPAGLDDRLSPPTDRRRRRRPPPHSSPAPNDLMRSIAIVGARKAMAPAKPLNTNLRLK